MKQIAINIKTNLWNEMIRSLRDGRWTVTARYLGIDAGFDYDYIVLRKGVEKIEFGWTNWFEGEIRGSESVLIGLQQRFDIEFSFGEAYSLKKEVMETYRIYSWPLFVLKWFRFEA